MARSEDDQNPGQTRSEIERDSVKEPVLSDSPANPGTEPHTAPGLTTDDRRKTEPGAAGSASAGAVYDDRKQTATDPHAASGARETVDGPAGSDPGLVDKLLGSVEPRPANTGTMGASGEHARLPHRDR